MSTNESTGLGEALEESDCHDISRVFGDGRDHGESSPEDHHAGEEDPRLQMVQRQVTGNLSDDIPVKISIHIPEDNIKRKSEGTVHFLSIICHSHPRPE